MLAPVVGCLLVAAVVGAAPHLVASLPWFGGIVVGAVVFMLLRAVHWFQQFYSMPTQRGRLQQPQQVLKQQEDLVRQLARQVPCPWWAPAVGWCALLPLCVVSGLLAITVGQFWVLWVHSKPKRFWLKACLHFEVAFWWLVIWAAIRTVTGLDSATSRLVQLAVATACGTVIRGTLKLLFDVEDKMGITLFGLECWHQAFVPCSMAGLGLFALFMRGMFGGLWLLVVCRFRQTPWQLAARLEMLPRQ